MKLTEDHLKKLLEFVHNRESGHDPQANAEILVREMVSYVQKRKVEATYK
ncbi:hypothetical protein [Bacillus sp. JCM 19034]|nr:hypothetical protein [Bacillus sp. JCM 19034]